jgi:uncharacterized membrane protein YeaQ/YmgE (transglycosylase-associated protein family)
MMLADYSWLWWIVIGFAAGGIAKLLMPGRDPGGCVITILLGIGGAMLAGTLGRLLGAVLILFVYRLVLKRR